MDKELKELNEIFSPCEDAKMADVQDEETCSSTGDGPSKMRIEVSVTPELQESLKRSISTIKAKEEGQKRGEKRRKTELRRNVITAKRLSAKIILLSKEYKKTIEAIEKLL
ncbi:hypothetical protein OS493_011039 [Desmophyllum pertusum]|uniref:Uncharacterized protein n=1 Tax=Desmophyllum pertusum TaxID=174260 RepID=A0A9W9ZEV7_9CNID|nr:hypothetical protein OS493_011039 [Desmophyllum pertusum]